MKCRGHMKNKILESALSLLYKGICFGFSRSLSGHVSRDHFSSLQKCYIDLQGYNVLCPNCKSPELGHEFISKFLAFPLHVKVKTQAAYKINTYNNQIFSSSLDTPRQCVVLF